MADYEGKVTKIGNSYGVTFPIEVLKEAGISYGDDVHMEVKDRKVILQKKEEIPLPEGVVHDFMKVMNVLSDVISEHDVAFKGLVDK